MKKVGIVTITTGENYGNRLQNYALQNFLLTLNIKAETLHNYSGQNIVVHFIKYILKRTIFYYKFKNKIAREKNFKKFNNKNINFSNIYMDNTFYKNIDNKFDYFIAGSDQIWNLNYPENQIINFLGFVKDSNKKISYAASFGSIIIPKNFHPNIATWLKDFKMLSTREYDGIDIVKQISNRNDCIALIDPTMLLTAEEWDKVSKKPKNLKKDKYILNYFLGNLSENRKNEINRIAKENNCEIINILDINSPFYECGPSEFLWLEKNAFLICTDSFHSSIFAIIYNRPFIIFDREQKGLVNMNSRLETLISKFNLKNRKFEGKISKDNLNHDYSKAYKILEEERKKSKEFLEKALDLKEGYYCER